MQSRLTEEVIVPFIVFCLKLRWNIGADGPIRGSNGWFDKKPVFEQGNMVAQPQRRKKLKAFLDGFIGLVQVNPAERHDLQGGIKPLP